MKFFEPANAIACYVANRALSDGYIVSGPDGASTVGFQGEEPAPSLLLQALFPAGVALPCGLICVLKVEGDC
jgi:hypothetical protein